MDLPTLPNDILHKIICKVADESFLHLRPFIRAGRQSLQLVYTEEVLKKCKICWLRDLPSEVSPGGICRKFFEKCLEKGNKQAIYVEALRLATKCEDLPGGIELMKPIVPENAEAALATAIFHVCLGEPGGIELMKPIVPENAEAALATAIFHVCLGEPDMASETFEAFINHQGKLTSPLARMVGKDLLWDIYSYGPPNMDNYLIPFEYTHKDTIQIAECAFHHDPYYGINCSECYMYWVARRVCSLL